MFNFGNLRNEEYLYVQNHTNLHFVRQYFCVTTRGVLPTTKQALAHLSGEGVTLILARGIPVLPRDTHRQDLRKDFRQNQ